MKTPNLELVFLRTFAACTVVAMLLIINMAFKSDKNTRFKTIDVERINVVEADGTIKMVITNTEQFPNGDTKINNRPVNKDRKKRTGMLFFNEEGIECGGFIYDGAKTENGHSSGLSLTYDQYNGDQVMQLLTTDAKKGDKRVVSSSLVFNDRPVNENQLETNKVMDELNEIKDVTLRKQKYQEYIDKGILGGAPRIMLGKSRSENNGLFLFDNQGKPKAMFYVDKNNNAKLEFYDDKGNVISSWPN